MAETHAEKISKLQKIVADNAIFIADQEKRIAELEKLVINSDMPLKVSQHDAVVEEHIGRLSAVEKMADKARATADRAVEVLMGDSEGRFTNKGSREHALFHRINSLSDWRRKLETGFLGQLLNMHDRGVNNAVKDAKEKIRRSL